VAGRLPTWIKQRHRTGLNNRDTLADGEYTVPNVGRVDVDLDLSVEMAVDRWRDIDYWFDIDWI